MQYQEATPALSPASAGHELGADPVPDRVGDRPSDRGDRVGTGASSTMHYVRLQGASTERPFGVHRFSTDACGDLQRWDARVRTWFSDPSPARYQGMGGSWYDAVGVSEEEALIIAQLNEHARR